MTLAHHITFQSMVTIVANNPTPTTMAGLLFLSMHCLILGIRMFTFHFILKLEDIIKDMVRWGPFTAYVLENTLSSKTCKTQLARSTAIWFPGW